MIGWLFLYKIYIMSQSQSNQVEGHILRRFTVLKKVGSGAYGHVWKVEQKNTKKIYALKKIFDAFQHSTDAQRTYREIQILRQTDHPNIIKLYETIRADNNKDVYLVFEFMEADLHNVIAEGILKEVHIRFIIYQLAKALKYLHTGSIIHRDLKPSNILVNSNCAIKLCDFGLVRSLIVKDDNGPILTEGVATRWYRAPEVLLGSKSYSTPADIWSFACIIYEILAQKPLFPGNSTLDQIEKILSFTGFPTEDQIKSLESEVAKSMLKESKASNSSQSKGILKDFPSMFIDLLQKMLVINPKKRITIEEILAHEVVKPFHKPEEQIECRKQIRTSIDDNTKLTVDQYRKFVYGSKRTHTSYQSNFGQSKSLGGEKKSSSFNKAPSSNVNEKDGKPQKQTLRYVRSSKDVLKSTNAYNRSTEVKPAQNNALKYKSEHSSKQVTKEPSKTQYVNKNFYSPKFSAGDQKYSHPAVTAAWNSPKAALNNKETKPLFKSSKYIVHKQQHHNQPHNQEK